MNDDLPSDVDGHFTCKRSDWRQLKQLQQVCNIALIRRNESRNESIYSALFSRNSQSHLKRRSFDGGWSHTHTHTLHSHTTSHCIRSKCTRCRCDQWIFGLSVDFTFSGLSDGNAAKRQVLIRRSSQHTSCLCN